MTYLLTRYSLRFAVSVVAPVAAYAIQEHLLPRIVSAIEARIGNTKPVTVAEATASAIDIEDWNFWG